MDLSHLNEDQKKAVLATHGRVLVLAGAGSGKTKVLTTKIAYLITKCAISPESILGLTFTRKAAQEMSLRLKSIINPSIAKRVMLSTFHGFCTHVLRNDIQYLGYTKNFTIYDAQDVHRLAVDIAKDLLAHEGRLPSIQASLSAIQDAQNQGISPQDLAMCASSWHDSFVSDLYKRLSACLKAHNAVDFDHMLALCYELFSKHPAVLKKYSDRFQFVLIDEYQDTNPIQAKIANLLTEHSGNRCVVGDDDQSIYGWRGAEVANILQFKNTETIKLEQNYRSTNTILKAANSLICRNSKRHGKSLWSNKGDGASIEVFYAPNEVDEVQAIVQRLVKQKTEKKLRWKDFAILYRSNALSRNIETALLKQGYQVDGDTRRGVPYQIYGGDSLYEHKEIKDLLSYLRVSVNPSDEQAIIRSINFPKRGVGDGALEILTSYSRTTGVSLFHTLEKESHDKLSQKALVGIHQYLEIIRWIQESLAYMSCSTLLPGLIEKIALKKAIFDEVASDTMRKWKLENLQGLIDTLTSFENDQNEGASSKDILVEFLSTIHTDDTVKMKKERKATDDHVHVMTFHSAKGLEFESCFLLGIEDHLIPHEKSVEEAGNVEEERRLFYVAMTRAKSFLTLSMAATRKRMGSIEQSRPSRFLFEIPQEFFRTTKWDSL